MKPILILLFPLAICLLGCEREEPPINWSLFSAKASLNEDKVWQADRCWFGHRENGDIILHFNMSNAMGELREKIRFKYFPLETGNEPLAYQWRGISNDSILPTAYFDTFTADGEASTEFYDLIESNEFNHFVHIDYVSENEKVVEGTFQVAFVFSRESPSKLDPSRPDTLIFSNGSFKARLLE